MDAYNLDGIKTNLMKTLDQVESKIEAWEKVEFMTKKDGTPFKNMGKNVKNATYVKDDMYLQTHYELRVVCFTEYSGYISDSIKCTELVRYLKDENMINKTENYAPKESMLEQAYHYDINDIKKAVADHIKYLNEYKTELKKQIETADTVFKDFRVKYADAIGSLKAATAEYKHTDLYNMVLNTVKKRYPYC